MPQGSLEAHLVETGCRKVINYAYREYVASAKCKTGWSPELIEQPFGMASGVHPTQEIVY